MQLGKDSFRGIKKSSRGLHSRSWLCEVTGFEISLKMFSRALGVEL